MPEFDSRNPREPAFWDERFARGFTPWDRGGVPRQLRDFVAANKPLSTLIPGCGAAYELVYLCEQGWDATAIDFSPEAVSTARAGAGAWASRIEEADFFAWQGARALELIYERAFLCALPRAMWPQVAQRWVQLLAPGGRLAGYFFFDSAAKGPPFGTDRATLDALLTPFFRCVEESAVPDSIPVFEGKERWMVWERK
ncbi:MAG: methyltransferase [Pseudomonadota bacterium]